MEETTSRYTEYSPIHPTLEKIKHLKNGEERIGKSHGLTASMDQRDEETAYGADIPLSIKSPSLGGTVTSLIMTNILTILLCIALLNYITQPIQHKSCVEVPDNSVWCKQSEIIYLLTMLTTPFMPKHLPKISSLTTRKHGCVICAKNHHILANHLQLRICYGMISPKASCLPGCNDGKFIPTIHRRTHHTRFIIRFKIVERNRPFP